VGGREPAVRVLGIAGSPRRRSNTDILLDEVLRGAASQGAETKTLYITSLNIGPCQNCEVCLYSGDCPFRDDMPKVYEDLAWADRIVLAAPLQFMGLPSQIKALIDRGQSAWARKYRMKIPPLGDTRERWGLFVSVGGRKGENLFDGALATVRSYFFSLDVKYAGILAFSGIENRGDINSHPEALQAAFDAGQKLASSSELPQLRVIA
jgi:multimeric flavodoxin WrbA